jgi:four helix bundle protein
MLAIYSVALELLRELRPLLANIDRHDRDLGRQLRRAATSVVLNMGEASGSFGGTRRERYRSAYGSICEVRAGLDAADALGYVGASAQARLEVARVAAGLAKLAG